MSFDTDCNSLASETERIALADDDTKTRAAIQYECIPVKSWLNQILKIEICDCSHKIYGCGARVHLHLNTVLETFELLDMSVTA